MDMFGIIKFQLPRVAWVPFERVAYVLWGGLAFVAAVFAVRGSAGAFHQEMSALAAGLGTMLAALASLAALGCHRLFRAGFSSRREHLSIAALTVLPPTLLGIAISPASSSWGIAWVTAWGIGLTICVELLGRQGAETPGDSRETMEEGAAFSVPMGTDPDLTQWMTRRVLADEGDRWDAIEGQSAVEFAAGQQTAAVHLSICPPMLRVPEIECEVLDHPEIEWKVAAQHPYGVRLEVRRPNPATEPLSIALGYHMAALLKRDRKAG